MRFLFDQSGSKCTPNDLCAGQLLTPLSNYRLGEQPFAIDSGAFSGFDMDAWLRLLDKCRFAMERCLFVALPDVVGSARRTLEAFGWWADRLDCVWPRALVAHDGLEDLEIPWNRIQAIFIGGSTTWKESQAAADVVLAAKIIGVHTHVGRINTIRRFRMFERLGADTCDGSGIVRFGWMLDAIRNGLQDDHPRLPFGDGVCGGDGSLQPIDEDVVAGG